MDKNIFINFSQPLWYSNATGIYAHKAVTLCRPLECVNEAGKTRTTAYPAEPLQRSLNYQGTHFTPAGRSHPNGEPGGCSRVLMCLKLCRLLIDTVPPKKPLCTPLSPTNKHRLYLLGKQNSITLGIRNFSRVVASSLPFHSVIVIEISVHLL